MSLPAEAFIHGYVREFQSGQLLTHGGVWYLLTGMHHEGRRVVLVLNGPQIGRVVLLQVDDRLFAVAPAFTWRPIVPSVPQPMEAQVGSLFFGPAGPAFRSWANGQVVYTFGRSGENITQDFPYDAVSVPAWGMGLYWGDAPGEPIGALFEVDVTPVEVVPG